MATTMSAVWDRSVAVLQGRGGMLAGIAVPTIFIPTIVRAAAQAYADPASPGVMLLVALVGIVAVMVTLWGHLAIIAAASDPAVLRGEALRMASRRLPVAIGMGLLVFVVVALLFSPVAVAMAHAGLDMRAMAAGSNAAVPPPVAGFVGLYTLAFLVAALFVGARMVLFSPVILLERTGGGAFARSFRLTRGLTWRILGVLLLYIVLLLVASGAARLVIGSVAALVLGAGGTATFVAAVAAAIVTTILVVVAVVFTAQLYVATRSPILVAEARPLS